MIRAFSSSLILQKSNYFKYTECEVFNLPMDIIISISHKVILSLTPMPQCLPVPQTPHLPIPNPQFSCCHSQISDILYGSEHFKLSQSRCCSEARGCPNKLFDGASASAKSIYLH